MESAKKLYERLANARDPWLRRARTNALYTTPALFPREGQDGTSSLAQPHQSLGARGVKNLAAKLMLILLPPNLPFWRYSVRGFELDKLQEGDGPGNIQKALAKVERTLLGRLETSNLRSILFELLKQLLVAGNVLLWHNRQENTYRLLRMDTYVVRRSPSGEVTDLVIKMQQRKDHFTDEQRLVLELDKENASELDSEKPVDLYTRASLEGNRYVVHQEVNEKIVPGSEGWYPRSSPVWIAARLFPEDGEDWGRSYVEEYIGDLFTYDGLIGSIHDGAAAAAKILIFLEPSSATRARDLEKPNLSIVSGRARDVSFLGMDKAADFRVALEAARDAAARLEHAFLLNSTVQRQAERVTAEEVRFMASELEDALGGVYSSLADELQVPLVRLNERIMTQAKQLPELPDDVNPTITTGLAALGRGQDLNRIKGFLSDLGQLGGPEILQSVLGVDELIRRLSAGWGIDPEGLVLDQQEQQRRLGQQQLLQLLQSAGPNVIEQITQERGVDSLLPNNL